MKHWTALLFLGVVLVLGATLWSELRPRWTGRPEPVDALAISPDGRLLACVGPHALALYDLSRSRTEATLRLERPLTDVNPSGLRALAFASNSSVLYTLAGTEVTRWDDGSPQSVVESADTMACSRDGKLIATTPGSAVVIAPTGRTETYSLTKPGLSLLAIASSPDVKLAATLVRTQAGQVMVRVQTLAEDRLVAAHPASDDGVPDNLRFLPDGTAVIFGQDHALHMWNFTTGDERVLPTPDGTRLLAMSPNGERAVTGAPGDSATATVWDLTSLTPERELRGHAYRVNCAAFTPDGKTVITGGNDWTLRFWTLE